MTVLEKLKIFDVQEDGYPHGRVGHFLVWAYGSEDPAMCTFNPDSQLFILTWHPGIAIQRPLYWTYVHTLTMVARAFQFGE